MTEIEQLKARLAKAEAACASMRREIEDFVRISSCVCDLGKGCRHCAMERTLSDCGQGWLSPEAKEEFMGAECKEQARLIRERDEARETNKALVEALKEIRDNEALSVESLSFVAEQALALSKGKNHD